MEGWDGPIGTRVALSNHETLGAVSLVNLSDGSIMTKRLNSPYATDASSAVPTVRSMAFAFSSVAGSCSLVNDAAQAQTCEQHFKTNNIP